MTDPIITHAAARVGDAAQPFAATGGSFAIHEWRGSGPAALHVHHADDEAWHVLEGSIKFRFSDREIDVEAGSTVFVPAGVAHTYEAPEARYLLILTPRLMALISELHGSPDPNTHAEIYRKYESELLE